jgi:hypothetical protein
MYFKHKISRQKQKNLKRMLKLIYFFSMSKLIELYFQPFQTPLLSISHEKHPCQYMMKFE